MKQCKECCRDISREESEQYNGYCKKCYKIIKEDDENNKTVNKNEKNIAASIIKAISIIGAIISVIYGLNLLGSYTTSTIGFFVIIISIISAVFIYGLGEIIQLLEDIRNK